MKKELADSIPLNVSDISIDKTQLILVKIRPPENDNQIRNVDQIFKDLDAMVRANERNITSYV